MHPEGSRYFVHTKNVRNIHQLLKADEYLNYNMQRTFTEINICDDEMRKDIEYYMEYLLDELKSEENYKKSRLDMSHIDLVIEPRALEDDVVCHYYFANHRDRCLFWLDDFDTEDCKVLHDCKGIESLSHIRRCSIVLGGSGFEC